jgi:hypothetical protein
MMGQFVVVEPGDEVVEPGDDGAGQSPDHDHHHG